MPEKGLAPDEIYRRMGRLIESAPTFGGIGPLSVDQMTWLGRAEALVTAGGGLAAQTDFAVSRKQLSIPSQRPRAHQELMLVLYRVLASAELASPAGLQGAFIPVGNSFDAYAAVAKVMSSAKRDVFIVDPYMDDTVLTDFGGTVVDDVGLRLLTDQATVKPNLAPATARWKAQYPTRPVEVRIAPPRALHDRAILIDGREAWTITQSLKDLAKRSPAEIVRANDIAPLKIASYEDIWSTATIIA